MGSDQLKLNEFKALHKALTRNMPPWLSFLVLGFLVWVEEKFIDIKIKTEVDEAIKEYETLQTDAPEVALFSPEVVVAPPVYSETGDDFFDEMRLSSPWMAQEDPSDSP
jgi:hypothetical protein